MGENIFPSLKQLTLQSMYHPQTSDLPEAGKNIIPKITEAVFSRIMGHVAIWEAQTSYSDRKRLCFAFFSLATQRLVSIWTERAKYAVMTKKRQEVQYKLGDL